MEILSDASWALILADAARALIFIIPAWLANSSPVLLGGLFPIDGGAKFSDGRPLFGRGKTWLGLAAGICVGTLGGVLLAHLTYGTGFAVWGENRANYLLGAFLLSCGAMLGDLAGSFIKRRLGQGEGTQSYVLDQLTFLAVAILLALPLSPPVLTPINIAFLFVITYFVHRGANWWAHISGLKKVPW